RPRRRARHERRRGEEERPALLARLDVRQRGAPSVLGEGAGEIALHDVDLEVAAQAHRRDDLPADLKIRPTEISSCLRTSGTPLSPRGAEAPSFADRIRRASSTSASSALRTRRAAVARWMFSTLAMSSVPRPSL